MNEKKTTLYVMNHAERAARDRVKALHLRLRAPLRGGRSGSRDDLLAWAYARGLPFRRCERTNRRQVEDGCVTWENRPDLYRLWARLQETGFFGEEHPVDVSRAAWQRVRSSAEVAAIAAWLADPRGAVPPPPPRPKRAHVPPIPPVQEAAA